MQAATRYTAGTDRTAADPTVPLATFLHAISLSRLPAPQAAPRAPPPSNMRRHSRHHRCREAGHDRFAPQRIPSKADLSFYVLAGRFSVELLLRSVSRGGLAGGVGRRRAENLALRAPSSPVGKAFTTDSRDPHPPANHGRGPLPPAAFGGPCPARSGASDTGPECGSGRPALAP